MITPKTTFLAAILGKADVQVKLEGAGGGFFSGNGLSVGVSRRHQTFCEPCLVGRKCMIYKEKQ